MPSIFISTAHKNAKDEQEGTGDIDYARTLAKQLQDSFKESSVQPSSSSTSSSVEESVSANIVECIQGIHEEETIYQNIREFKAKHPQNREPIILHIMINPPKTGCAFKPENIEKFKKETGVKVVITSIEFAKYDEQQKSQAANYFEVADQLIFLDEYDKQAAKSYIPYELLPKNTSVIPVQATIPEIPELREPKDRENNILFFGMIRQAKGIGYLLQLAELKKDTDQLKDMKIIMVGTIQRHVLENIEELKKIMVAMYPSKEVEITQLIADKFADPAINTKSESEQATEIIGALETKLTEYESDATLTKELPIELHLNVPVKDLHVHFNKCKYAVLPIVRGGSLRNSGMTNMLSHKFITMSFEGEATPEILKSGQQHDGAMVLLEQEGFAEKLHDELQRREMEPELNKKTYKKMESLLEDVLSLKTIIKTYKDLYKGLENTALKTSQLDEQKKSDEQQLYEKIYAQYRRALIKTIRTDEVNYWPMFVKGMLGQDLTPLRMDEKQDKAHKVSSDGVISRNTTTGKFKPTYSPKEKEANLEGKCKILLIHEKDLPKKLGTKYAPAIVLKDDGNFELIVNTQKGVKKIANNTGFSLQELLDKILPIKATQELTTQTQELYLPWDHEIIQKIISPEIGHIFRGSKPQSTSVVAPQEGLSTQFFGFNKRDNLSGIIFFSETAEKDDHLLTSIKMLYDGGTVGRPYYFETEAEALQYYSDKTAGNVWHKTIDSLIKATKTSMESLKDTDKTVYNEILARLKWIPEDLRCQIGIFYTGVGSNSDRRLAAKLTAQIRAIDLKINTGATFIPISFYDPSKSLESFSPYLLEQQQTDLELALSPVCTDPNVKIMALMINSYQKGEYIDLKNLPSPITIKDLSEFCFSQKVTIETKLTFLTLMLRNFLIEKGIDPNSLNEKNIIGILIDKNIIKELGIKFDTNETIVGMSELVLETLVDFSVLPDKGNKLKSLLDSTKVNENYIWMILEELPIDLRFNFLERLNTLGVDLQKFITIDNDYYNVVYTILELLPENLRMKFVEKYAVGELKNLSLDGIKNMFEKLPKDSHMDFLEKIGMDFLREKLDGAGDVISILEELPDNSRMDFLEKIGMDFLREKIDRAGDVSVILYKLPEISRMDFLEKIGIDFLKSKIDRATDVIHILYKLSETSCMDFLEKIGMDFLKSEIYSAYGVAEILDQLPETSRMDFLEKIGIDFLKSNIEKARDVVLILEKLPENLHMDFLEKIGIDFLKSKIEKEKGRDVAEIFNVLPKNSRMSFLEKMGVAFLMPDIDNAYNVAEILDKLPETSHMDFLDKIGIDFLKSKFDSLYGFIAILEKLPENLHMDFLEKIGMEFLKSKIKDCSDVMLILYKLPKESYAPFLKSLEIEYLKGLGEYEKSDIDKIIAVLKTTDVGYCEEIQRHFLSTDDLAISGVHSDLTARFSVPSITPTFSSSSSVSLPNDSSKPVDIPTEGQEKKSSLGGS